MLLPGFLELVICSFFRYNNLQFPFYYGSDPTEFKSQMSEQMPRDFFGKGCFPALGNCKAIVYDNVCFGEQSKRFTNLLSRFHLCEGQLTTSSTWPVVKPYSPWFTFGGEGALDLEPTFQMIIQLFMFNRGSTRYTVVHRGSSAENRVSMCPGDLVLSNPLANFPGLGITYTNPVTNENTTVEVPYYNKSLCRSYRNSYYSREYLNAQIDIYGGDVSHSCLYVVSVAAGEDFILGYPVAPPIIAITTSVDQKTGKSVCLRSLNKQAFFEKTELRSSEEQTYSTVRNPSVPNAIVE